MTDYIKALSSYFKQCFLISCVVLKARSLREIQLKASHSGELGDFIPLIFIGYKWYKLNNYFCMNIINYKEQ